MVSVERFRELINHKLTETQFDECINILDADVSDECQLVNELYSFYVKQIGMKNLTGLKKLHFVVVKYLLKSSLYNFNPQELYYLEMIYYYQTCIFSRSLFYTNLLLDLEEASVTYKVRAINTALTILASKKLNQEAYDYIEMFEQYSIDKKLSAEEYASYYIVVADIYAQSQDIANYGAILVKIGHYLKDIKDKQIYNRLEYYVKIHHLYQKALLSKSMSVNKAEIIHELNNIFAIINKYDLYSCEYALFFITIIDLIKDEISMEQVIEYVRKLLKVNLNSQNKIHILRYILEEYQLEYDKYIDIYKEYYDALQLYFNYAQESTTLNIKAEVSARTMRKEYVVMNDKYQIDALTCCFNRFVLLELENNLLNEDSAIIYMDLNELKIINDEFGHAFGDKLLQSFGLCLKNTKPQSTKCIRYGGDEFVAILENTNKDIIIDFITKLREAFSIIHIDDRIKEKLGFSVGIYLSNGTKTIKDAVRLADEAMYRSKKEGKDYVFCS